MTRRRGTDWKSPGLERVMYCSIPSTSLALDLARNFNRSFSPEDSPGKLIYVRELDSELPSDRGHVDRVS